MIAIANLRYRAGICLVGLTLLWVGVGGQGAIADCVTPENGNVVTLNVAACETIVAADNSTVQHYAGHWLETWNLRKAYTGALVTDNNGTRWMYPSSATDPCQQFPLNQVAQKRAYFTCCDTGRWGKCVFGGRWLGDLNAEPINAFQ